MSLQYKVVTARYLIRGNFDQIVRNITSELRKPILDINYWNFFQNLMVPGTNFGVSPLPTKELIEELLDALLADAHRYFHETDDKVNLYKIFIIQPFINFNDREITIAPSTRYTSGTNTIVSRLCEIRPADITDHTEIDLWIRGTLSSFESSVRTKLHEKISSKEYDFWKLIRICFSALLTENDDATGEFGVHAFLEFFAFRPVVKLLNFIFDASNVTISDMTTRNLHNAYNAHVRPDIVVKENIKLKCFLEAKRPPLQPTIEGRGIIERNRFLGIIKQMLSYCINLQLTKSMLSDGKCLYLTFFKEDMDLITSTEVIDDIDKVSKLIVIDEIYSHNPTFEDKVTLNMIISLLLYEQFFLDKEIDNAVPSSGSVLSSKDDIILRTKLNKSLPAKRKSPGDFNVDSTETPDNSTTQNKVTEYNFLYQITYKQMQYKVMELPIFEIDEQQQFKVISEADPYYAHSSSEIVRLSMDDFVQQFGLPFSYSYHSNYSNYVILKIYDLNYTAGYVKKHSDEINSWDCKKHMDPIGYYYKNTIYQQYMPELEANLRIQNYNMSFPKRKFNTAGLLSYGILRQMNGYLGYFLSFTEIEDFNEKRPKTLKHISKGIQQLEILHSCIGITHRDIADRNIAYDKNSGEFSIIDFDRAKVYKCVNDVDPLEVKKDMAAMKNLIPAEK